MFLAVDGIDGAGKTTLVRRLKVRLDSFHPLITKEPTGDSVWGKRLRDSAVRGRLSRETETEYFHRDRIHHLETVIRPALKAGHVVITDRYVDSTLAFQARTPEEANQLYRQFLSEIIVPDLTIILDCPVEIGLSRIKRSRARFSAFEDIATLERAREIYASRIDLNYVHIDASGSARDTLHYACNAIGLAVPRLKQSLSADSELIEGMSAIA